jgi:H+/Cl- antiporter ClcA
MSETPAAPEPPSAPAPAPVLSGGAYLRLVGLGALIGIPAALVAVGFLALVHQIEEWLWHDLPDALGHSAPPWYLVIALPVIGALFVIAARRLLPGDGGHSPLKGLDPRPTPAAYGPGVVLAALGSLPFGAVLGPEAPLIALGSVVGLALTAWVRLGEEERTVVATAGSFAAVAALFGGPLVAGVLLVEAGISRGRALIAALLPGLVAAGIGYTIFIGIGDWGGLSAQQLTIPGLPRYDDIHIPDLLLAIAIGVLAALALGVVRAVGGAVAAQQSRRFGIAGLLLAGGLAVGLIAQLAAWLGADSADVLFSGQTTVASITGEDSVGIVVLLIAAKGIAYAICLGCGFRGGPVFPAIFLGIALGTLGVIAFDLSPTVAVAAGAAAGMAAATRLLFASLLLGTLLAGTQGLDAAPAAVLAVSAAWIVTAALDRRAAASAAAGTAAVVAPA